MMKQLVKTGAGRGLSAPPKHLFTAATWERGSGGACHGCKMLQGPLTPGMWGGDGK